MTDIAKVARAISGIRLSGRAVNKIKSEFRKVTLENEVYQGTREGNGINLNNFEWTMCQTMLINVISRQIEMSMLFDDPTVAPDMAG